MPEDAADVPLAPVGPPAVCAVPSSDRRMSGRNWKAWGCSSADGLVGMRKADDDGDEGSEEDEDDFLASLLQKCKNEVDERDKSEGRGSYFHLYGHICYGQDRKIRGDY